MARILSLVVLLALLSPGAATARERQIAGTISAVSLAGTDVAYADEYRPGCHEVRLWSVTSFADRRLASHCFAGTSTGSGIGGVIASGDRALWLTYTGGNIREWSLWTKAGKVRAKRLAFLTADVDGPAPVVLGGVWEGSLPYAVGRTIVVLHPNGSRRFSLAAADRVVSLSANTRGYAAVLANGSVLTISQAGVVLRERSFAPGAVEAAVLAAPGLVLKTAAGLEVHRDETVRKLPLPRGARFVGFSAWRVAYATGRELRAIHVATGQDALFGRLDAPGFHAQFGRRGLVYASGRTLGFTNRGRF